MHSSPQAQYHVVGCRSLLVIMPQISRINISATVKTDFDLVFSLNASMNYKPVIVLTTSCNTDVIRFLINRSTISL